MEFSDYECNFNCFYEDPGKIRKTLRKSDVDLKTSFKNDEK
jgi:hypothetical protein